MSGIDLKQEDEEIVVKGKTKIPFKEKLKLFWSKPKNRWITIISIIILTIGLFALGYYLLIYRDGGMKLGLDVKKEEKAPEVFKSILDGTETTKELSTRHPLGIMIENHTDARPQYGLTSASIIYEAIAEGGITRFLAVFSPRDAEKVGPIRSARTYYVDWIKELNGYYAHIGGNYDALELIKSNGILDLDQFSNPSAYWREYKKGVSSEHTVYTATSKLYKIASDKKYSTDNNFVLTKFKTELEKEKRPATETITINFGNANYNVSYNFDPATNSYGRILAGKPHIDTANNQQISAKNVIVQVVNRRSTVTKINEQGWIMDTVGNGSASVFQDGAEIKATWKKDNSSSRTRFFNKATGAEIELNAGQTWIEVISPDLSFSAQ
ncbi:MAG: Uncharacterized protein Athens101428_168 [Candidatus Berkelbacteria bacterium Athens1014_28]|uniref:DUF3048 domain-containing protein n=1 Tax=Candidatus Berkelbacteria bacterium Athens1014_28 TaxID=2017145 RepID=A0A554LPM7_9BACT|nr:MAG: Uncharacterized protein Athens101428_168 [Candidatus Berkelbacteria bacterium Athens1014_28]